MKDKINIHHEDIISLIRNGWNGNPLVETFSNLTNLDDIVFNSTFLNYYTAISSTKLHIVIEQKSRKCRFCQGDKTLTSFNKEAHLLSAFLGSPFIHYDECDNCNSIFSKYESHFSKYYGPYLTLLGIEGRNGIPKFSSRSNDDTQLNRTTITYKENGEREINMVHINDFPFDNKTKNGTLNIRTVPLKMLNIYKLLVKYGLSVLPLNKSTEHIEAFKWIINTNSKCLPLPFLFEKRLTGKMFAVPDITLFERKNSFQDNNIYTPKYTGLLSFANVICQFFLPVVDDEYDYFAEKIKSKKLPRIHSDFVFADINNVRHVNLSNETSTYQDYQIHLSFERVESHKE